MKLGLQPGTVKLRKYSSRYKKLFEIERLLLEQLFGEVNPIIAHIGSTSIPNIKAKPIIDMLLVIPEYSIMELVIGKINSIGYIKCSFQPRGEFLFKRGDENLSTHYLHLVLENQDWRRYIIFRDYLIQNPDEATKYESLKTELEKKYKNDRRMYTSSKEAYIENILSILR